MTFEQLLQSQLETVPIDDPIKYIDFMYASIHPGMVTLAVKDAKALVDKENKQKNKQGTKANVFLTLGGDGNTKSLYTGAVGAMLWLQDYMPIAAEKFNISKDDLETTKRVLRSIGLPQTFDAKVDDTTEEYVAPSGCRHYATFLGSFVTWMTSAVGCVSIRSKKMKSNAELTKFLTNMALKSFPSIPFTSYYIGSTKTNDMMGLAEKMSRVINFTKYMTEESIMINQPMFVVQNENSPLVGISGHPLGGIIFGQGDGSSNTDWLGAFTDNEEFSNLCTKSGINIRDVKKYILQTNRQAHDKNISKGNPIALFIQSQNIMLQAFEKRHMHYGNDEMFSVDESEELRKLLDDDE